MKSFAEYQGDDTLMGSRDAVRWAFENHLITDGQVWMNMIRSRNETSHDYDDSMAVEVVKQVVDNYFPAMYDFYTRMSQLAASVPNDLFSQQ